MQMVFLMRNQMRGLYTISDSTPVRWLKGRFGSPSSPVCVVWSTPPLWAESGPDLPGLQAHHDGSPHIARPEVQLPHLISILLASCPLR